jgi:hypothetical protein
MLGAIAIWAVVVPRALADPPGCDDGKICWWSDTDFKGDRGRQDCGQVWQMDFQQDKHSAKNRCGNSIMILYYYDGTYPPTKKGCLGPGDSRPDPGRFNEIQLGAPGGPGCGS